MGKWALLLFDLLIVISSPFVSILLRDNFLLIPEKLENAVPYALNCAAVGCIAFLFAGVHRGVWRYVSLHDLVRVIKAVTATVIVSAFIAFTLKFYQGIALSVPFIQWAFIMTMMCLVRLAARMLSDRTRLMSEDAVGEKQTVLLVGVNDIAELYLRWTQKITPGCIEVVGLVDDMQPLKGNFVQSHQIVGRPSELSQLLTKFKVHGVQINRIVLAEPIESLCEEARQVLERVGETGDIIIDDLGGDIERLFRRSAEFEAFKDRQMLSASVRPQPLSGRGDHIWPYLVLKRIIDIAACLVLAFVLSPLFLVVGGMVLIRHGYPVTFWQSRLGKNGRDFRLYKFRSMSAGWDDDGNEIPADRRLSRLGTFLRRTRLDELPQLYNILKGEMSFVGPRPLLREDQPDNCEARLSVRPGLTGWAQINGGQAVSQDDKAALDLWYLKNASFWLDLKITLLTVRVLLRRGERVNKAVIRRAYRDLGIRVASQCSPAAPYDVSGVDGFTSASKFSSSEFSSGSGGQKVA